MNNCLQTVVLLALLLLLVDRGAAQSLNEKLIAEDPTQLATQARANGNIIRGAILFHQGNINCAKCHRPTAESERIGPDLSRLGPDVTDAFLVESILQPSKTIKEGFETVSALTADGLTIHGLIVRQDNDQVTIRDSQDPDRIVSLKRKDLDEIQPSKNSSMPDGLANELKNRQQFLDLLRYVIDIKERGPSTNPVETGSVPRAELSPELNGLVLIQKMNCTACHQADPNPAEFVAKQAPKLKWSGKRLNPRFLESFIADPNQLKPGTTMPLVLGHLNPTERAQAAKAITHYLVSTANNEFRAEDIDRDAVSRGFELFQNVGCVACHSPRNQSAAEQPLPDSVPLGELTGKYNLTGLVEFLENPHIVRSSGHMPKMKLTHREATEISNFLLQSQTAPATPWQPDPRLIREGKLLFSKHNCAQCHSEFEATAPPQTPQLTLDKLNSEKGCLSNDRGQWPDFHLQPQERESIRAALIAQPIKLTNEQKIDVTLTSFNCLACHSRGDLGGVTDQRNFLFHTTNLNLGDQGRIPPTLTGVGAKLNSDWMRDVLVNGRTIRPYMKIRMPQYGEQNIGHLVELFQATDQLPATKFAEFDDQKTIREQGLKLAGNQGLNCAACHTYQYKLADTMPAVDLTEMAERLKKDWFYQYMLDPQKFSPNTVMPSFWPGGVAIRRDIEGSPEIQIEALWQYLIDGRQASMPSGVVREPLEIVVADEAKMLRRSYPGIGKRGIGVGYPHGVNLAFDAEQMRLNNIWKGKFVDPGGVWTGQGSGNVRPMNQSLDFPKGPDLDDASNPWEVDEGRPPDHRFLGYSLDPVRRPTLRYEFDSVIVDDFFTEIADDANQEKFHLRRTVSLSSSRGRAGMRFRIATAHEIKAEKDGTFSVGNLKIHLVSDHNAQIINTGEEQQLQIPIDLATGEDQKLVFDYVWK